MSPTYWTGSQGFPTELLPPGFACTRSAGKLMPNPAHVLIPVTSPPVASTSPVSACFLPGGLSTAEWQMEERCKINVGRGRDFHNIWQQCFSMLAQHSTTYKYIHTCFLSGSQRWALIPSLRFCLPFLYRQMPFEMSRSFLDHGPRGRMNSFLMSIPISASPHHFCETSIKHISERVGAGRGCRDYLIQLSH